MIKFKVTGTSGRQLVGLGITALNVEALKHGQPIHIMGTEMGLPFDITIFYGATERKIFDELKKAGLIDPEHTVIHDTMDKPKPRN